jgi:hypothetical protein
MNYRKCLLLIVLLAAILLLAACGREKGGWKGTTRQENGLTIISNPKEPMYSEQVLTLEKELTIGGAEAKGEGAFSSLQALAVDKDGNMFVLSYKDSAVFVYDREGNFLRKFGRPGQGPGELSYPMTISIQDDRVMVLESIRRISFFTREGTYLKSLSTKDRWVLLAGLDSKGNIYGTEPVMATDNPVYKLLKFDGEMNLSKEITSCPGPNPDKGLNPFMPVSFWQITPADDVLYSRPADYTLEYYDHEGTIFKKVIKAYDPVKVTEEEKESFKKEMGRMGGEIKVNMSDYHPAFRRFICDDKGRLFVQTYEKSAEGNYIYDIFDAEGRFITRVPMKGRPFVCKNEKLYCQEEDESGYELVVRYSLKWNLK